VSRPRKPFGARQPGRLPSTMMKVLAAEMSDPQRLRRGKHYAKDGSVLDIEVEPGVVSCEIQGSRSTPYLASLEVTAGDGMPLRRDVSAICTCPDSDNFDGYACKHVIAAMFAFSDELLIEPELLDVWRRRESTDADRGGVDDGADDQTDASRPARHLRVVPDPDDAGPGDDDPEAEPTSGDPLEEFLSVPGGAQLPAVPHLDPVEPPAPRRPELARVLRDALGHVRVDWD